MFNNFRSHIRKYYPDQYEAIENKLDEIVGSNLYQKLKSKNFT